MSVKVEFVLVDRGQEMGRQQQEFDNLSLAQQEQEDGMDVCSRTNVEGRWVDLRVLNDDAEAGR